MLKFPVLVTGATLVLGYTTTDAGIVELIFAAGVLAVNDYY